MCSSRRVAPVETVEGIGALSVILRIDPDWIAGPFAGGRPETSWNSLL
jgi:hypothetical protein